ncbi:MAG: M20 family metallo-hydrolase [Bryobacteraceae bacterium]
MNPSINQDRLMAELDRLAGFSDVPAPAVMRVVFSAVDLQAREYFTQLCTAAGFQVREDAVGNTFVRWIGSDPSLPAVGTGSHIDAIPYSGRYDGTVGVLGGLEAMRALQESGFQPLRSIELLLFTSEEPTRFGIGCLGSRLLSGALDAAAGDKLKDKDGSTLNEVRANAGFTGSLENVRLAPGYYHAFAELHIEQGPLLERREVPLGVVTAIAAPASLRIVIEGEGGHAGAVLMPDRRDAFSGAAELALALESAARSTGAIDTVATIGQCDVFPGAVNGIPSRVTLGVDVRDIDPARRDGVLQSLAEACGRVARERRLQIQTEMVNADAPAICGSMVVDALAESCSEMALPFDRMVSRAYHDSLFVSRIAPTAMLFIPCRNGVSHRPDEYASPQDIGRGTLVLAATLARLAGTRSQS